MTIRRLKDAGLRRRVVDAVARRDGRAAANFALALGRVRAYALFVRFTGIGLAEFDEMVRDWEDGRTS